MKRNMLKIKGCIVIVFLILFTSCQVKEQNKDKEAYLLVYFKDPTHSIHLAISDDGYTFTDVNDGNPVIAGDTLASQNGIRDPHITRGPHGAFYMAMTDLHVFGKQWGLRDTYWERNGDVYGWGNNKGFVLMKSNDLINWTYKNVHLNHLFPEYEKIGCAWAPQTIYDPHVNKMMIYFTMRMKKERTQMYYAYTDDDFTTLTTKPELLFEYPDTTVQVLDADITPLSDGRYCMMYVAQEKEHNGVKMAFSDKINEGYEYLPEWIDKEPGACEAPNVWKRIGEDKWVLMYDIFSIQPHNFGFCETSDFKTFKNLGHFNEGVMKTTNFTSPKHGAVIQITKQEAQHLKDYWYDKGQTRVKKDIPLDSVQLSDPCILADKATETYYLTGTGGLLWKSKDLKKWSGPYNVAKTNDQSWMGKAPMIWAAEIHQYKGKYYYFATFTNKATKIDTVKGNVIPRRASHVLVSDKAEGPYVPMQDPTYLPANKPTLDGTFWVDQDGKPYMVYCYEWLQSMDSEGNLDGTMDKIELKSDLSGSVGEGELMFRASASPWSKEYDEEGKLRTSKVTDGPWLFETQTGKLGMIWTSWVHDKYTQGVAYSNTGTLDGPWIQEKEPITPPNFGHGMLFRTFDGQLLMSVHSHRNENGRFIRYPKLFKVDDSGDKIVVGEKY
ncbi:family 43 glycosylhydrolase [uncultured Draconibacterium sp.]|uniref:family 43 glycosylhydrolase n=1 Tax=uncultured Draconibacterium sp. TaxID=1573823 RepID=UPI0032176BFF